MNGDGVLDIQEITLAFKQWRKEDIKKAFELFDADHNDSISRDEFDDVMSERDETT
jgi:Ca2+-binding EF-hand superfamily protein